MPLVTGIRFKVLRNENVVQLNSHVITGCGRSKIIVS